jgi:hypothetical protein
LEWCLKRSIEPYRRSGSCFAGQENRDAARKTAGCFRYGTPDGPDALAEAYRCLCPPGSYFYPSARITGKIRLENGCCGKVYGKPKTPCQRLLESADVGDEAKAELKKRAAAYNPADLKIAMDKARNRLCPCSYTRRTPCLLV